MTEKGRKTFARLGVLILIVGGFFGLRYAAQHGYGRKYMPSFMLPKIALDDQTNAPTLQGSALTFAGLPSTTVAAMSGAPQVRVNFWAWNSQMGCEYANGGPVTTEGSLMQKAGIKMTIARQDDNNQLMAQLTALAKSMHDGQSDPTDGVQFVGIMGDGSHAFLSALNGELTKTYGPEYHAEIVGSCGYSRGEDKLMGPKEWKDNPQSLRGSVIAGVVRDGDWNIAMRYAADNNIPNNPDETTYDPKLINWVNTSSFTDAAEKYVQNYCEDRKVVDNGKPTGETKHVCVQGAVTWTPGDVTMAEKRGGVVSVISTKQYTNQMPHVLIGIHKWDQTHADVVTKMLGAFLEGGDQVLTFPKALDRAAEVAQSINQEAGADANYWKKYYLGVQEPDKMGTVVDLGGSKANNLADDLLLFGLNDGSSPQTSPFHATFTVFGNLVHDMYPKLVPSKPDMDSVVDLSYLRSLKNSAGSNIGHAEVATYSPTATITKVVGRRGVSIEFATGSADLTPTGQAELAKLSDELTINSLLVQIHGHTDNTGDMNKNQQLSEERAIAVKTWLENHAPSTFPPGRITATGHGSSEPVASNATEAGRRANRRVEIVIGQQ
jgi:outer membrane protein OmpA-like peptidoglycan-associated protein